MPLFPLPLAPFERYMWIDDRPDYPMTFEVLLSFRGELDAAALRAAVAAARDRHPLLAAHLEARGRRLYWTEATHQPPAIDIQPLAQPLSYPDGMRIDLKHHSGLRVFVRHGGAAGIMRFQFHHACTDGLGAFAFLGDFLAAYDAAFSAARATSPVPDTARLAARNTFGQSALGRLLRKPLEVAAMAFGVPLFFLGRPEPIAGGCHGAEGLPPQAAALDWPAFELPADQLAALRNTARQSRATVNDVLLRDLFLALHEWNQQHGGAEQARLRVMLPQNLREPGDEAMPAANLVGMALLDRRPGRHRDAAALLRSLRRETHIIKRLRRGLTFVRVCGMIGRIPGGLESLTSAKRCYATSVLSNLGHVLPAVAGTEPTGPLTAGGLTVEQVRWTPPVRPWTRAAFGVATYAGRLSVAMNYDPRHFTAAQAEELLKYFQRRVQASAA